MKPMTEQSTQISDADRTELAQLGQRLIDLLSLHVITGANDQGVPYASELVDFSTDRQILNYTLRRGGDLLRRLFPEEPPIA
jgi:hypothetical protein